MNHTLKSPSKRATLKTGVWLFPLILIATLLQNYYDITAILSGEPLALYRYDGPIVFKVIKDILYLLICCCIIFWAMRINKFPIKELSFVIYILVFFAATVSLLINDVMTAAIGLRWALPFLIFFALGDWTRSFDRSRVIFWLVMGMLICLFAQIYQLFYMPPVYGEVLPGIPARTPGIFLAPNSTAFFACASLACLIACADNQRWLIIQTSLIAFAICLLTQSGTGIIVCLLLILRLFASRSTILFSIIAIVFVGLVLPNLNSLTMREDYIELSGGGRLDVLFNIIKTEAFSFGGFGSYTNASNLLSDDPQNMVAVDSLVASWIGNFGILSTLILLLVLLFLRHNMREIDWKRAMPCVIVLGLFSLTTIVFEAFPMNLYLAFGIWLSRKSLTN